MTRSVFENDTIITAERGKLLKLVEREDSVEIIGKPERIIFSNQGNIPEFEEILKFLEKLQEEIVEKMSDYIA